jgi:hypothetical protein
LGLKQLIEIKDADNAYDQTAQGIGHGRECMYILYKYEIYYQGNDI